MELILFATGANLGRHYHRHERLLFPMDLKTFRRPRFFSSHVGGSASGVSLVFDTTGYTGNRPRLARYGSATIGDGSVKIGVGGVPIGDHSSTSRIAFVP